MWLPAAYGASGRKLPDKDVAVLERLYLTAEDFAADVAVASKLPEMR